MADLIAGVDWSSQAIDVALIPLRTDLAAGACPPVTFRREPFPPKLRGMERIRSAAPMMSRALRDVVTQHNGHRQRHPIRSVWIEEAFGARMNTTRVLLPIFGAMVAAVPADIAVAGLSPPEWRKHHGLQSSGTYPKARSVEAAQVWSDLGLQVDEHQAEALLIALAGKNLIWRHADDS